MGSFKLHQCFTKSLSNQLRYPSASVFQLQRRLKEPIKTGGRSSCYDAGHHDVYCKLHGLAALEYKIKRVYETLLCGIFVEIYKKFAPTNFSSFRVLTSQNRMEMTSLSHQTKTASGVADAVLEPNSSYRLYFSYYSYSVMKRALIATKILLLQIGF